MQKSQSQSQKPYILTMPNISPGMHSYSVAEWERRGPSLSLFDDEEAKLQYLTMIGGKRDGTLLLAQQDDCWNNDVQGGGIFVVKKEEKTLLESRHHREEEPAAAYRRRVSKKKKISLAEYSKKSVSSDGRRSAGEPEGARSMKENETLLVADKTPERAPDCGISLSASVGSKLSTGTGGNGTQEDKESSGKKRGQKR